MRCLPLLGALFLAAPSLAAAQIQISAQTQRNDFLLYERVDLFVTVQNVGGTDLVLDNNEGRPWLSFMVSKHEHGNDFPVQPERKANFPGLMLKAGESKTFKVNLTPLFAFREEGEFRASAVVDLPGAGQMISDPVPFTVLNGRTVWSQVHAVEGSQRTYSLITFSPNINGTTLYLRVEDPVENMVYANIALGQIVASIDPEVFFDPAGNLHILHPVAPGAYLYSRADPDGKILHQAIFKSAPSPDTPFGTVPPHLVKIDDGNVLVSGGLTEDANKPRERLSDSQGIPHAAASADDPLPAAAAP
jgi:hypothetical protein